MLTRLLKSTLFFLLLFPFCSISQPLAFPTAEGYGKYTTGGRGGAVYEVTNLNSSGAGSFGDAVNASGARIIVFRISGTIQGDFTISNPNITIAGQTAPGDGITIKGRLAISANNVIVRYIRVRATGTGDAFGGRYNDNIIIDHVTVSWSGDEVMSIYHGNYVTIQWCIISEACSADHKFGGIWGNNHSTYHHNLFAHNTDRNPRIASGSGYNDVRNNVIYNWKNESTYGGEMLQVGGPEFNYCSTNLVANYYKPGPGTPLENKTKICAPWSRNGALDYGKWYLSDNYLVGYPDITTDNWKGVRPSLTAVGSQAFNPNDLDAIPGLKLDSPSEYMPINQQTAEEAYIDVLLDAGCSLPKRDIIDNRIINEVSSGTTTYGSLGFVNNPSAAGGWPVLNSTPPPTDTDHDGMSDAWETANSLNPNSNADQNLYSLNTSYTNIEIYLNSLVEKTIVPVTGVTVTPATVNVNKGETTQLTATVAPTDATNKNVTWSSSNTSVATVSLTGLVTGVAVGNATITATTEDGSFTASCGVTGTDINIPVTGVTVSPTILTLNTNYTSQLTATFVPSNASNKTVTWSSSNTSIATVNSSGLITGIAEGSATITATTVDGSFTATCSVNVVYSPLPTPLIKLGFNENTGSTINNEGSISTTFTKSEPPTWNTNIPVNGGTSSVDFGTTTGNNYVESSAVISELAGLTSFTITGWVNCRNLTVGSGGNRIVSWINNGANGVDIVHAADGSLKVGINQWPDASTAISSTGKITADINSGTSNWKFFAVTYESTSSTIKFFFGDNTYTVSLDKSLTYNKGAVGTTIGSLAVGHFNTQSSRTTRTDRMFKGLIDQVEIYGSALSLDELQVVQNIGTSSTIKNSIEQTCLIFPNPVLGELTIKFDQKVKDGTTIQLFDMMGRNYISEEVCGFQHRLEMGSLPSGAYILKILYSNTCISKQIIKQ